MDDIDATPRRPLDAQPVKSPLLNDIDATPRRMPAPREIKIPPPGDIDATPRRLPRLEKKVEPPAARGVEPPPRIVARPHIVGPGRTNKPLVPLPALPALETLTPRSRPGEKITSRPLSCETRRNLASQVVEALAPEEVHSTPVQLIPESKVQKAMVISKRPFAPTRRRKRTHHRRRWLLWLLVCTLLLVLLIGGGISYSFYLFETNVLRPLAQFFRPVGDNNETAIDGRSWNLLLLGSDNDQKFVYPNLLTQVMMIVRIDPSNNRVSLVSIPRDSWVHVPGKTGMHKIDQAFFLGASARSNFNDGVRLARATIEQDYGVTVDRYAWIGLEGFSSVINTLGGVDIDLRHPLLDDSYPDDTHKGTKSRNPYAIKRIYLPPGPQHLSGDDALEYVRSRHADLVGDIGRTQRQQEILQALKQKLNVSAIFDHLNELFHDLTGKVYTDMSQDELVSLGSFARNLPPQAISHLTLGPGHGQQNYGMLTRLLDPSVGSIQDVVLPNCANIQPKLNEIFDLGNAQSCQINGPVSERKPLPSLTRVLPGSERPARLIDLYYALSELPGEPSKPVPALPVRQS